MHKITKFIIASFLVLLVFLALPKGSSAKLVECYDDTRCGSCTCSGTKRCCEYTTCLNTVTGKWQTGSAHECYTKSCSIPSSCYECSSCTSGNCCGVTCGSGYSCTGSKLYGCSCVRQKVCAKCTTDFCCGDTCGPSQSCKGDVYSGCSCATNCLPYGSSCSSGTCCSPYSCTLTPYGKYCLSSSLSCGSGTTYCSGYGCLNLSTNDAHCGSCANSCDSDEDCVNGTCKSTTTLCKYGTCGFSSADYGVTCGDTEAEQKAGVGDTCIHLINSTTCRCTSEQDPSTYECEPYRDWQVVGGVCYQQWECCKTETDPLGNKIKTCFYQIRQTCDPVGGGGDGGDTPTCSVSLTPSSATFAEGSLASFAAGVAASGSIDYVSFSSANTNVASVSPSSDSAESYITTATGMSAGSATVRADVVMEGSTRCADSAEVTVAPPGPWWQARDSDILADKSLI